MFLLPLLLLVLLMLLLPLLLLVLLMLLLPLLLLALVLLLTVLLMILLPMLLLVLLMLLYNIKLISDHVIRSLFTTVINVCSTITFIIINYNKLWIIRMASPDRASQ